MWVTAYTDASFNAAHVGWGVWLRCEKGRVVEFGSGPADTVDSMEAEMWAVFNAIRIAQLNWPKMTGIQVNTDCSAILNMFYPWSDLTTRACHARVQIKIKELLAQHGIRIRTKHVKAHTGRGDVRSWLNRQVDKLSRRRS